MKDWAKQIRDSYPTVEQVARVFAELAKVLKRRST